MARPQPNPASIFGETTEPEAVAAGEYGFVRPEHAEFPPILIVAVTHACDMACIHCAHPVIRRDPGLPGHDDGSGSPHADRGTDKALPGSALGLPLRGRRRIPAAAAS